MAGFSNGPSMGGEGGIACEENLLRLGMIIMNDLQLGNFKILLRLY
jgi:hypothetical protein